MEQIVINNYKSSKSDNKNMKKIVQINPEWIEGIKIKLIDNNYRKLQYKINASIINDLDFIKIYTNNHENGEKYSCIIEKNLFINQIIEKSTFWVDYPFIESLILPIVQLKDNEIKDILFELIKLKFFITNLDFPLKNINNLDRLLKELSSIETEKQRFLLLEDINSLITLYKNLKLGEGISVLKLINDKVKN